MRRCAAIWYWSSVEVDPWKDVARTSAHSPSEGFQRLAFGRGRVRGRYRCGGDRRSRPADRAGDRRRARRAGAGPDGDRRAGAAWRRGHVVRGHLGRAQAEAGGRRDGVRARRGRRPGRLPRRRVGHGRRQDRGDGGGHRRGARRLRDGGPTPAKSVDPKICIPTTAGTGSEFSSTNIFTRRQEGLGVGRGDQARARHSRPEARR